PVRQPPKTQFVIVGSEFHPKGRDNGYVVTVGDRRIYFSGQSELTPEMKALKNLEVAMLPIGGSDPWMSPKDAAEAALAMRPKTLVLSPQGPADWQEVTDRLRGTQIDVRILKPPA